MLPRDIDRYVVLVMIFCEGICRLTVRRDTRRHLLLELRSASGRGHARRKLAEQEEHTPLSYCLSTRSKPRHRLTRQMTRMKIHIPMTPQTACFAGD